MTPISRTPEANEVLSLLEGRWPQEPDHFQSLVALLMERHWPAFVTLLNKRCFSADSSCDLTHMQMDTGTPLPLRLPPIPIFQGGRSMTHTLALIPMLCGLL
jgi:hypothetical protein